MPNPYDNPSLYDTFFLAGVQAPGVWTVTTPTIDEGWKKQEPKGKDGGETTRDGRKLIDIDMEGYLFKDPSIGRDDFALWDAFIVTLKLPIAKNDKKALDIYHPQLEGADISSVVVANWTAHPQPVKGKGAGIVKIKFTQYAPPKPASSGKPKGSKGGGSGGGTGEAEKPDPNADIKAELEAATADYNAV